MSVHEQIDRLSLNEAIITEMVEHPSIDASNAIAWFRTAQSNLLDWNNVGASGSAQFLAKMRSEEDVDSILIMSTRNGQRSIFESI